MKKGYKLKYIYKLNVISDITPMILNNLIIVTITEKTNSFRGQPNAPSPPPPPATRKGQQ